MHLLHDAPGRLRRITVTESETTRFLELDGCEEGAMFLDSEAPVFHYLWFHKLSKLADPRPGQALVLGAGAFTGAKCLALDHPGATVHAVDEESELESVARRFFRLDRPEFAGVVFHGMPAEEYLAGDLPRFDFIFDDLFDGFQHVPESSRVRGHFEQLRRVLSPGGIFVKNLIWNPLVAATRAACEEAESALAAAFPHHAVLVLGFPDRGHNRILLGGNRELPASEELLDCLKRNGMPEEVVCNTQIEGIV